MLFPNEGWESGDAGGWTFSGSSPPGVSLLVPRTGLYSLRYYNNSVNFYGGLAAFIVDDPVELDSLRFQTMIFTVWYWGEASHNEEDTIYISDGLTTTHTDLVHDAGFVLNTVSKYIGATATMVKYGITFSRGGTGPVGAQYVDDMTSTPAALPAPLDYDAMVPIELTQINPTNFNGAGGGARASADMEEAPTYFSGSGGGGKTKKLTEVKPAYVLSGDIIYKGGMVGIPPSFTQLLS